MKKCIICGSSRFSYIKNLFDDRYGAEGKHIIEFCDNCGFGKTIPGLTDSSIASFYSNHYPLKNINVNDVIKSVDKSSIFKKWVKGTNNVAHQYIRSGVKVLDIGSASGVSLLEIQNLGSEAYGVEPDINAKKIAEKLKLNIYSGLITEKPFPGKKFDYITGSQVIEHTTNPLKFIEAINKKLKKDGILILSFPNANSVYRYIFGKKWINWHIPYHLNHFTKKSVIKLSKKTGFKIIKIKTVTPNLWTGIQFASIFTKLIYKEPSVLFNDINKDSKQNKINKYILNTIVRGISFGITPINRLIDLLGFGDSFIVILSKK